DVCRRRFCQQTDGRRTRNERDYHRRASRSHHAQNGCALARRVGALDRQARHSPPPESLNKPIVAGPPAPCIRSRDVEGCGFMLPSNRVVAAIDDDRRVRESIQSMLESAGYDAVTFESGEAFLES